MPGVACGLRPSPACQARQPYMLRVPYLYYTRPTQYLNHQRSRGFWWLLGYGFWGFGGLLGLGWFRFTFWFFNFGMKQRVWCVFGMQEVVLVDLAALTQHNGRQPD